MGKRMLFVNILLMLILFVSACTWNGEQWVESSDLEEVNTEHYAINEGIPCDQYDYRMSFGQSGKEDENLTGIGKWIIYSQNDAFPVCVGVQIINDYQTYEKIISEALAKRDSIADEPFVIGKSQNAFSGREIGEVDFEQYDFLLVDFLSKYAMRLYPRLEELSVQGEKVSVELLYDAAEAITANNCGVLYFIPIPKGCTQAEVIHIPTSFAE